MEFALGRSSHGGRVKEEKRSESSGGGADEARRKEEIDVEAPPMVETGPKAPSTKKGEEADEVESAKAEMGEVIQENQRLKQCLDRALKDYRTLQMQFHDVVQKETKESADKKHDHDHQELITEESDELVSLSLGRVSSYPRNYEKSKVFQPILKDEQYKENLALGLDCKFETSKSGSTIEALPDSSPANSSEVPKDEAGETWPPSKVLKTMRDNGGEDDVSQQNPAKKARVCVRARCEAPTMNDGCQWRKYGQKIAKGNPCPRAYYRCTVAPSCPVRKQVQRYAQDMSILITTYEGIHNHPLPLSATAMASTTSAAASMLLSGSISSSSRPGSTATPTTSPDLHGLNFYLSDGSKSKQFYLSNPALSSSPSHPTITLDLTTNPASSSSHFGRFTSNYNPPRYPSSTSLNFNSSQPTNAIPWSNDFLGHNNKTINLGRSTMENIYQLPYMQKNNNPIPPAHHNLPDTIAAATKAITADPTFQSALAAALSSIIGNGSSGIGSIQGNHHGVGESLAHKIMKWGEVFPAASSSLPSSTSKVNGCASSLMNKPPTNAVQTGSLMFLPPSLPFSSSKSASASPGDNRDNAN